MINPAVFIKAPLNFKNKFFIYPPSVKDVIQTTNFSQLQSVFLVSQEDIRDSLLQKGETQIPTPFEFLLINSYHHPEYAEIVKEAFRFFLHTEITFIFERKKIVIGQLEEWVIKASSLSDLVVLTEEDYFDFQNLIRMATGEKILKPPEPPNPNEDPRIARIKAKARERDRIKARKGVVGGISLSTSLVAICCMGIGITPLNIGEMSYASISPIMLMLQNKEKYEIDIQSLLAGADSKKIKPKYWIRNLDEK